MAESVDVLLSLETRSYFWALTEVTVKVSSKRRGSDMMGYSWRECVVYVGKREMLEWK